jgi:hypothetical protein
MQVVKERLCWKQAQPLVRMADVFLAQRPLGTYLVDYSCPLIPLHFLICPPNSTCWLSWTSSIK